MITNIVNTVFGIKGIAATVAITALVVGTPAYIKGRYDGVASNEKKWTTGVKHVKDRVEDGQEKLGAIPDTAPGIAEQGAKEKIELGNRSQRKMGNLEGKIDALLYDLENREIGQNECDTMPLPDAVVLRHSKLDRLLEGTGSAGRASEDED